METEVVKPSKVFYGIAALILVAGIFLFVYFLLNGISESIGGINNQVIVPGTSTIELNEAGKYTIYFESRTTVNGKIYDVENINGLKCSLKDAETGMPVTLSNSLVHSNYSISGRKGTSVFEFVIDKAGKYELNASYESGEGKEAVLAIGKGFAKGLVKTLLMSMASLFIGIGGSIGLFIFIKVKRQRYSRML